MMRIAALAYVKFAQRGKTNNTMKKHTKKRKKNKKNMKKNTKRNNKHYTCTAN